MNIFDFDMPSDTRDKLIQANDNITGEPRRAAAISRTFLSSGGAAAAFASINLGLVRLNSKRKGDLVAAEQRFRSALAFSDTISDAHAGLAESLDRQTGRAVEAEATYARAVELMEMDARRGRRRWRRWWKNTEAELDWARSAVEATSLRWFVVCAACLCELRSERGVVQTTPVDESLFECAVTNDEALDDGYGMDNRTWTNFHWAWATVRALTGRVDEAVRGLRRAVRAKQLWDQDAARIAAELRDGQGDVPGAIAELVAYQARLSIHDERLPDDLADLLVRFCWIVGDERAACEALRGRLAPLARELEESGLERNERKEIKSRIARYRRALSPKGIARERARTLERLANEPRYAAYRNSWGQA